jgi:hypothetical protein
MKKLIPILAVIFFIIMSIDSKAQTKEYAMIESYVAAINVYIGEIKTESIRVSIETSSAEQIKLINKMASEGWKIVSSSSYASGTNTIITVRLVYLERDKK